MPTFGSKVKRLERLRQHLRRHYGEPPRLTVTHPVEHAVRTILAEEAAADQVDQAMDRLRRHFVDMNDLRVSRPREIRDVLGPNFPRSGYKARVIPRLLDQVFKQHNSMVWDFLEAMGKVQTRAYFEKLEEVRPFVAATIARDCVGAHAVPVDNDVARVLGRVGILQPDTQTEAEMGSFLERAVKSHRAYEVHWLVKRHAEQACLVESPRCVACFLVAMCPSAVVPTKGKARKGAGKAPRKAAGKTPASPAGKKAAGRKARPAPAGRLPDGQAAAPRAGGKKSGRSARP